MHIYVSSEADQRYGKGKEDWWYLSNAIKRYYPCKRHVFQVR